VVTWHTTIGHPIEALQKFLSFKRFAAVSLGFALSKNCSAFSIHVPRIPVLKSF
jgi:hypothetical protein